MTLLCVYWFLIYSRCHHHFQTIQDACAGMTTTTTTTSTSASSPVAPSIHPSHHPRFPRQLAKNNNARPAFVSTTSRPPSPAETAGPPPPGPLSQHHRALRPKRLKGPSVLPSSLPSSIRSNIPFLSFSTTKIPKDNKNSTNKISWPID